MSDTQQYDNQGSPQENHQVEENNGWYSKIYKIFLIYVVFSLISKFFKQGGTNTNNEFMFKNIFDEKTQFNINFYFQESKTPLARDQVKKRGSPILKIENLNYLPDGNSSFIVENEISHQLNLKFTDDTNIKSKNLYLYAEIELTDPNLNLELYKKFHEADGPFFHHLNILKYSDNMNEMIKQKDMINDLESASIQHDSEKQELNTNKNLVKNLYYNPEITLYLLSYENNVDFHTFEELRILGTLTKINYDKKTFAPNFCLSDFWTMISDMKPVEKIQDSENSYDSHAEIKVKIHFKFITPFYFKYMRGIEFNSQLMENNFSIPGSKDIFVELLKNNSVTYLTIMFTVNILHTIFSVMGFASDVSYYKNLKQLDGVYTKHLFFHIFQMLVAFLYVGIEGSHFLVKIELAVGLVIELWKLKKIFRLEFSRCFPFISLKYKIDFKLKKSKDYETEAVNLMLKWLFLPVAVIYLSYRIYYFKSTLTRSIFKFVIEYVFFLMNLFGFILLTPQVYLNYKLKSVQHLPFKALTFKFLNTIIDDLYAFAVKTPTLYRIFCFKDDVIFVILIIQIIKYRNNKRIEEEPAELEEDSNKETNLNEKKNN
jgi:hypothetical protein